MLSNNSIFFPTSFARYTTLGTTEIGHGDNDSNHVTSFFHSFFFFVLRMFENDLLFSESGVEPKTFRFPVRILYHLVTGDSWELRPLNYFIGSWDKYPAYC